METSRTGCAVVADFCVSLPSLFLTDLTRGKSVRACLPVTRNACFQHDGRRDSAPAQAGAARLARFGPSLTPLGLRLAPAANGTGRGATGASPNRSRKRAGCAGWFLQGSSSLGVCTGMAGQNCPHLAFRATLSRKRARGRGVKTAPPPRRRHTRPAPVSPRPCQTRSSACRLRHRQPGRSRTSGETPVRLWHGPVRPRRR